MTNEKILPDEWAAMTPEQSRRFYSLGYCCALLEVSPGQLRVLMEDTELVFDHVIDGVPYLDGDQFDVVIEKCKAVRAEIQSASRSHASN